MTKRLLGLCAGIFLVAFLIYWNASDLVGSKPSGNSQANIKTEASQDKESGLPVVGSLAPDFDVLSLEGKTQSLRDFRGKVVILNFWATWCPECKQEMPLLEDFYQKQKSNGVEVFAINVMQRDSRESIIKYINENKLTFPIAMDQRQNAAQKFGVRFLPATYVIDKQGMIADAKIGSLTKEDLDAYVKKFGTSKP